MVKTGEMKKLYKEFKENVEIARSMKVRSLCGCDPPGVFFFFLSDFVGIFIFATGRC